MGKFKKQRFSKRYHAFKKQKGQRIHRLKNHPFVVPVVTFIVLFFATAAIFVLTGSKPLAPSDSHVVIVSHDKQRQTVPTRAKTVGDLLKRIHVTLRKGDVVEPAIDTPIQEDNFRVNVYRGRPITIIDGKHKVLTYSAASTPRGVTRQAGINVFAEDTLTTKPIDNVLQNGIGEEIVIDRATPVVLSLYGHPLALRTHAKTVKELLDEKKVDLADGETVQPGIKKAIKPHLVIFVNKKGIRVKTVSEDIAPKTKIVEDDSLSFGTTVVRQQGSPGKRIVIYQINVKTGKKKKLQQVIVEQPVPQILARGKLIDIARDRTGAMAAAGIPSSQYGAVNYIISRESNWNLTAQNASGCLGLGQRCPGSALISACPAWQVDAVCQLRYFTDYANSRTFGPYGNGWSAAYQYWLANGSW